MNGNIFGNRINILYTIENEVVRDIIEAQNMDTDSSTDYDEMSGEDDEERRERRQYNKRVAKMKEYYEKRKSIPIKRSRPIYRHHKRYLKRKNVYKEYFKNAGKGLHITREYEYTNKSDIPLLTLPEIPFIPNLEEQEGENSIHTLIYDGIQHLATGIVVAGMNIDIINRAQETAKDNLFTNKFNDIKKDHKRTYTGLSSISTIPRHRPTDSVQSNISLDTNATFYSQETEAKPEQVKPVKKETRAEYPPMYMHLPTSYGYTTQQKQWVKRQRFIHNLLSQTFRIFTSAYISMFVVNWVDGWMLKIPYFNSFQQFLYAPVVLENQTYSGYNYTMESEMGVEYSASLFSFTISQLVVSIIISVCFLQNYKKYFHIRPSSIICCFMCLLVPFIVLNGVIIFLSQNSRDALFLNPVFNPFTPPDTHITIYNETTGFYARQMIVPQKHREQELVISDCLLNSALIQAAYNASLPLLFKCENFFKQPWMDATILKNATIECEKTTTYNTIAFPQIKLSALKPEKILSQVRNRIQLHSIVGFVMSIYMITSLFYYFIFYIHSGYNEKIEEYLHRSLYS
jgi:hypothetical protein